MKNFFTYIIMLLIIIISSCNNNKNKPQNIIKSNQKETVHPKYSGYEINNKKLIDSLKNAILNRGDTNAFFELYMYYEEARIDYEILSYAIIMAQKYNCNYAYFCVSNIFRNLELYNKKENDEQTKNISMYYLARSKELGYYKENIIHNYHNGKEDSIKESGYYLKKMIIQDGIHLSNKKRNFKNLICTYKP